MNALQGIRAVEFSRILAGSLLAQSLGDLGTDIIRVELVEHGHNNRRWPPFRDGEGAIYLSTIRRLKAGNTLTQRSTHPWQLRSTSAQT